MACEFCLKTRKKTMRVFGYSIPLFLVILIAFYLGAKNPGLWAKLPIIGRF